MGQAGGVDGYSSSKFPSVDVARAWYESPEYQEILPIRLRNSKDNMVIVEGVQS
jgi:uncharacterized protein (DUF1330 family)